MDCPIPDVDAVIQLVLEKQIAAHLRDIVHHASATGNLCRDLGEAILRVVESFPEGLQVVMFGSGGISHRLQGRCAGLFNKRFEAAFLN